MFPYLYIGLNKHAFCSLGLMAMESGAPETGTSNPRKNAPAIIQRTAV